jgi:hypothetical protein
MTIRKISNIEQGISKSEVADERKDLVADISSPGTSCWAFDIAAAGIAGAGQ